MVCLIGAGHPQKIYVYIFANKIVHVSFNVNLDTLMKVYFTQC